jgi:hypothetical protein
MKFTTRRFPARLLVLFSLCCLLTACDLDETLTFNVDGGGTYVARLSVEKQFAEYMPKIAEDARQRGFKVEESESPDRKILIMRRDFANVAELNDSKDTYSLLVERQAAFRRNYVLTVNINPAWVNSIQNRTIHVSLPVSVLSTTNGTISGRRVDWDCRNGRSLVIRAAGIPMPFGLNPALLALVLLGLIVAGAITLRKRRGPAAAVCSRCATPLVAAAQFCPACGESATATA